MSMPNIPGTLTPENERITRRIALICNSAILIIGILDVVGIILNIPEFYNWNFHGKAMNIETALALILLATGFLFQNYRWFKTTLWNRLAAMVSYSGVLVLGLLELFDYLSVSQGVSLMAFISPESPVAGHPSLYADVAILISASCSLFNFLSPRTAQWPFISFWCVQIPAIFLINLAAYTLASNLGNLPFARYAMALPSSSAFFMYGISLLLLSSRDKYAFIRSFFSQQRQIRYFASIMIVVWAALIGWESFSGNRHLIRAEWGLISVRNLAMDLGFLSFSFSSFLMGFGLYLIGMLDEKGILANQLQASEEQHRTLVEGVKDYAIIQLTPAGLINSWNLGAERITGYTGKEILGQPVSTLFAPQDLAENKPADALQEALHKDNYEEEGLRVKKGGEVFWASSVITAIYNPKGRHLGYSKIIRDISERKLMETALRTAYDDLELKIAERTEELVQANRTLKKNEDLRSQFISTLTHDLRTPLIAQKRMLEVFEEELADFPNARMTFLANGLLKNNDGLLNLVNKVLDAYQYEDGHIKLVLEPIQAEDILRACIEEISGLAQARKIELIQTIVPGIDSIYGDYYQLKRVFINLMGNALENIQEGSTLQMTAQEDGQYIKVTISDNGPGIPEEMLPQLFDKYFTASRTRQKIGSGLGLYICKMIIDLHNGRIEVSSQLGKGTDFTLHLPKLPMDESEP